MSAAAMLQHTTTYPDLLREARRRHAANQLAEAANSYAEALRLHPKSPTALLGLSLLARQTNQLEHAQQMAVAALRSSLAGSAEAALTWAHLGHCLFAQHKTDAAQAAFEEALKPLSATPCLPQSEPPSLDNQEGSSATSRTETARQARVEAHVGLGELFSAMANPAKAIPHFETALALQPGLAAAHYGLGSCRLIQSVTCADFELALGCFKRAVHFAPTSPESHFAVGFIEGRQGRPRQAVDAYNRAIQCRPAFASAWLNMGVALVADGSEQFAEPCYRRAVAVLPVDSSEYQGLTRTAGTAKTAAAANDTHVSALLNIGHLFRHRRQYDKAQVEYQQAFELAVANHLQLRLREVQISFTYLHLESGDFPAAWQALRKAEQAKQIGSPESKEKPQDPEVANARGILILAEQYARLAPASSSAHRPERPSASSVQTGLEDAIAAFAQAESLGHKSAASNRGNALLRLGRCTEALAAHEKAAALDPLNPGVRYNLALTQLRLGRYAEGWAEYEIRWSFRDIHPRPRRFAQTRWAGETLLTSPKTASLFIYSEQGLGDTLQFLRYLPLVAQRIQPPHGSQVELTLEVKAPLVRLLTPFLDRIAVKFPGVVTSLLCCDDPLPCLTHHCPLLSLPAVFQTTLATVPAICPAILNGQTVDLFADPSHITLRAAELATLSNTNQPRIGIAWAGNPNYRADFERSTRLATFLPLLELTQFSWISLQKSDSSLTPSDPNSPIGVPSHLLPHDGCSNDQDLADTAALIANLDLVITTDTSIAHLAGALGKPLWLLLPWQSDWRWMQETSRTPWYPTARLFRQSSLGDWSELMARVARELPHHFADSAVSALIEPASAGSHVSRPV